MVKQPAWAAASNYSGLVPSAVSNRVRYEYGVSLRTPESVCSVPVPSRPVPCHLALALRIMLSPPGSSLLDTFARRHADDLQLASRHHRQRDRHADPLGAEQANEIVAAGHRHAIERHDDHSGGEPAAGRGAVRLDR